MLFKGGYMLKIDVYLNGIFKESISYEKPMTINAILNDLSLEDIVAYTKNGVHVSSKDEINVSCKLDFIHFSSREGYRIMQDTTLFLLMKAFYRLFTPPSHLVVEHSIGEGIYCEAFSDHVLTFEDVERLKAEMVQLISDEVEIEKIKVNKVEAEEIFTKFEREDILKNLTKFDIYIYKCGNYYDYFLRQLLENTKQIMDFELFFHAPGLFIRFPKRGEKKVTHPFAIPKNLFSAHQEHDKWLNILAVHFVSALNRATDNFTIPEIIQIEEALHEKKIVDIAEQISRRKDVRIILIAGPSSSGKTTFAKRLSIHLKVLGITPKVVGMDDYFVSRHLTPIKENGEPDYESLKAIDVKLLNQHLTELLAGNVIELPKYNFISGVSEKSHKTLQLEKNEVLILEGIHGLNDQLTASVPFNQKVKIYVSALNNLNIDSHNRIPTSDSRRLRRIVRDNNFRGHTAEQTLQMWDSVREGEEQNIFPFQENADFMFNSILTYEIAVLKKFALPLLQRISEYSNQYSDAQYLMNILHHLHIIDVNYVPTNSILREFIGGSVFKY
jgi:uridine kinase